MAKRFLSFILFGFLLFSLCIVPTQAADNCITIIIDLTDYSGTVSGEFSGFVNENNGSLKAGQINTFTLYGDETDTLIANCLLNDLSGSYNSWNITGTMGSGEPIENYLVDYSDRQEISVLLLPIGEDEYPAITISGRSVVFNPLQLDTEELLWILFDYTWGVGTTIKLTPIISSGGDTNVSVVSSNEAQGRVDVISTDESNKYVISATANDGYAFSHWLERGIEDIPENRILNNPYTVTANTEITYVAYFRERFSVNVNSENTNKGTVSTEYIGAENGQDLFRLIATPSAYCTFSHWECDGEKYFTNPLEIAVGESGQSYTAYYTPIEWIISDDASLKVSNDVRNGFVTVDNASIYGGVVSVGCRSALYIPVTIPTDMENATIRLRVIDADNRLLADYSETRSFSKRSGYLCVTFDPTTANITDLRVEITLTTPAGSNTVTKTYSGLDVADGENNQDFRFVTSPDYDYGYITVEQAGVPVDGAFIKENSDTRALSLYFYGSGGVFAFDNSKSINLEKLEGLPSSGRVISLGPNGESDLTAAVKISIDNGRIILFNWDGENWSQVINSALIANSSLDNTTCALVMTANDVWTNFKHWTGESWEDHEYSFASFQRVSDTEAYGTGTNGTRWYYNGSTWEKISNIAAPDTTSVTTTPINGNTVNLGQDHHGNWYLFVTSRTHFIEDGSFTYNYSGSDVYKWDGSKWIYQIMSDFNDPNDDPMETRRRIRPDGVNSICVPAPGVTVMYGTQGDGALYLYTDNVTITFNPGEGALDNAALGTMTAPILSAIDSSKVPGARRDGYTFGGWYYDEACTIEFDASSTAMPGESITLYAKWTEGNAEDELQYYKDKAKSSLTKQYGKYAEADYTAENWTALTQAYADGQAAIDAAEPGAANIEDNVTAALNAAIAAMQAIPLKDTSKVTVAVSMDANTLGLGYILEPTLVTVDKGTPVSVVITDLLSQQAQAKYDITEPGKTTKVDGETLSTLYPWISDGAPTAGFYLSQVYYPEQTGYTIPATIQDYITGNQLAFVAADANGKYLGEFDYLNTSGWTYSVGDKTNGAAEFPGIGSNGWGVSDGEVIRWQFTLVGYGADLGADNTAWGTENILTVGDKSALTWKVAELRRDHSDAVLKANDAYNAALAVLTDAEATQEAVDAALAALEGVTFSEPPVIVTQPADRTVAEGKTAAFTVEATGDDLTYQWQYSKDGGESWKNKSGATKAEYSVKARASYDGILYRCLVTGGTETVESRSAKLTVYPLKPVIVTQPADQTAAEGQTAAFAVVAQGEDLTYQWQYSKDGGTNWHNKSGATAAEYSVKAKASYEGMLYRCKVTGAAGSVYTGSAKLTVYPLKPVIVTQPQNQTADAGKTATFTAEAQGEDLTYQWQYSNDDGKNWHNKSGAAGTSYSVKAKASYDGMLYRCKVTSAAGSVYTDSAKLTVVSKPKPVITAQPADRSVMAGETAVFTVVAEGEGLTFQWQYSNDGETWKNKSGATSASYSVKAKTSYDGILYRCLVTNDGGTVNSGSAKLTVTAAVKPVIETQPKAQTAAAGEKATFTVEASGTGLTYQWQYSSDYGKTWHDKAGSTAATHTVTVKASFNGYLYRCKVTNAAGTTVSSKVRLTVTGVKPKVLSQPADASAAAGEKATFKVVAAGEGLTYQWQYSTDGGVTWKNKSGATKASHSVTTKAGYNGYLYRCVVTNSVGSVTTDTAVLTVG